MVMRQTNTKIASIVCTLLAFATLSFWGCGTVQSSSPYLSTSESSLETSYSETVSSDESSEAPASSDSIASTSTSSVVNDLIESSMPDVSSHEEHILKIISDPGTVGNGYMASLSIKGKPHTDYTLSVHYPSGPSKAAGVGTKTSDSVGYVTWSWKVGTRTTPGIHDITITGGDEEIDTDFKTVR